MRIPEPLYRKLPVIYAVAAVALVGVFGPSLPIAISALMLLCASGLTTLWRHRYQTLYRAGASRRSEWARRRAKRIERLMS